MAGVYSLLAELIEAGKPAALATVISGGPVGAKMLVPGGGPVVGSIQAGLNSRIAEDALEMLADGRNKIRSYQADGQTLEVFIETFPPPQRLIIVGAVHIAIPLHRLAKMLGYHVTVVDPRGVLATRERFPLADNVLVEWPDEAMGRLGLDGGTSVVVLTHDPKLDYPALAAALRSEARYVGAIGSCTTNKQRLEALREDGLAADQLARLHAPVGLDIGAQTPAEIALAIMSEIVASRYGRDGGQLRLRDRRRTTDDRLPTMPEA